MATPRKPPKAKKTVGSVIPKRARGRPTGSGLKRGFGAPSLPACLRIKMPSIEATSRQEAADVMWLPQPEWIPHRLTVSGLIDEVTTFQGAAEGAGVIPWRLDDRSAEETWRNLLLSVPVRHRGISLEGIRIVTGDLRDAWSIRNEAAIERVGQVRDCPLDLHDLLPVPWAILALGEENPAALRWLWEHWGTTWPLRKVRMVQLPGDGRAKRVSIWAYHFSAADWSPWRAVEHMKQRWPKVVFELKPSY
jgi:hypothetical protein